jgi:hypothetical protein
MQLTEGLQAEGVTAEEEIRAAAPAGGELRSRAAAALCASGERAGEGAGGGEARASLL